MNSLQTKLDRILNRELDGFKTIASIERLTGGASQETFSIDCQTVSGPLRLALRRAPGGVRQSKEAGSIGLTAEAVLLDIAKQQGIQVPNILYSLKPEDNIGDGFLMNWCEGETLGAKIAKSERFENIRPSLARQCGEILAKIHSTDLSKSGLKTILKEISPRDYVKVTWEDYKRYETPQPMIDYAAQWLLKNLPEPTIPSLVHNDFRNGNLIVSENSGIVAVLDWEVAHIGDPNRDLGWLCTPSWRFGQHALPVGGFGEMEDLLEGYSSVTGTTPSARSLKFWQVFGSFWWAVHCLTMAHHYRHGPDKTVERPAIGRRSSECQIDLVNFLIPGRITTVEQQNEVQKNIPTDIELLTSVRDFLRSDIAEIAKGRKKFLNLVASNSLDILIRENKLGRPFEQHELDGLRSLLRKEGELDDLRQELTMLIRNDNTTLDNPFLQQHLRDTVAFRVSVDQPTYAGLITARENSHALKAQAL